MTGLKPGTVCFWAQVNNGWATRIDNRKKDILVLGEDRRDGLDNTITAEVKYAAKITRSRKRKCLILY